MQDSDVTWERLAVLLGIVATTLGIVSKAWRWPLRLIGKSLSAAAVWMGRRAVLSLLRSDKDEARRYLQDALAPELDAMRADLEKLHEIRRLVRTLEETLMALDAQVRDERYETRNDIAVLGARMAAEARETRDMIRRLTDEVLPNINRTLHTLTALVAGPDEVRSALREQLGRGGVTS